ncbi:response regulator [Spirosoma luteum]|uniref:response regulator n=1 Tax=Spirosoma luteum TaxID=431553 RepID=UPI00037947AD|nr:response regulator [Spirosoma luteum]
MNTLSGSIWLVDDDEDDLVLMKAAFHCMADRITIKALHDGEELLPHLQETSDSPNLIVMDLNMNRMGGLQALEIVRSVGKYSHLPVVMLTTSSNPADKRNSVALGANDYHIKPASFNELTVLANQLIRQWVMKPIA